MTTRYLLRHEADADGKAVVEAWAIWLLHHCNCLDDPDVLPHDARQSGVASANEGLQRGIARSEVVGGIAEGQGGQALLDLLCVSTFRPGIFSGKKYQNITAGILVI